MDIYNGDSCVPEDFIEESEKGAVYYNIALCCGPTWQPFSSSSSYFSLNSFLLALFIVPSLSALKHFIKSVIMDKVNKSGKSYIEKCWPALYEPDTQDGLLSIITFITVVDTIIHFAMAATSLAQIVFYPDSNYDLHKVNKHCKIGHCRFLIFLATLLYKPFVVSAFNLVLGVLDCSSVITDLMKEEYFSLGKSVIGLGMLWVMLLGAVYLLPVLCYSLILVILGLPLYLGVLALIIVSGICGMASLVFYYSINNDDDSKDFTYARTAFKCAFLAGICYVYVTLCLSRLYFGCGWKFTAKSLFSGIFEYVNLEMGIGWPYELPKSAQTTLVVSVASKTISITCTGFLSALCRDGNPSNSV